MKAVLMSLMSLVALVNVTAAFAQPGTKSTVKSSYYPDIETEQGENYYPDIETNEAEN